MSTMKTIVLIGATSAMAAQCARLWTAKEAARLVLAGRDSERLQRLAADLKARQPGAVVEIVAGGMTETADIEAMIARCLAVGRPDIVVIAHGNLPDQPACETSLVAARDAIEVNAISPVLFAEGFAGAMAKADHGTLVIIGSVAGDRGRRSNYVYGSAKGLVTRYAQGLQHRLAAGNVRVVLVKPGPTDTPMTAHLKAGGMRMASVEDVAAAIVAGAEKGTPVVYAPAKWGLIMMIIRHLPRFVFNKINI